MKKFLPALSRYGMITIMMLFMGSSFAQPSDHTRSVTITTILNN